MPSEDKHDWVPIAWWDKTTKSVRTMFSYENELAEHLRKIGALRFLIEKAERQLKLEKDRHE